MLIYNSFMSERGWRDGGVPLPQLIREYGFPDKGDVLPTGLSLEAMDRDAAIRDLLLPVHQQLSQILSLVDDTIMAAGSDLMKASLIVYRALQSHGEEAGLRTVRDELGRRFAKSSSKTEPEDEAPATVTTTLVPTTGGEGAGAAL